MSKKYFIFGILLILAGLLVVGCNSASASGVGLEPTEVTFDVSIVEIKGATDGIPAPEVNPRDLSDGYRFTPPGEFDPDNPEKWQVSTYMFSPAAMTVSQGDTVNLRVFVVNGDEHTVRIEGPDGLTAVRDTVLNRGREYILSFTANQAGYYVLECDEHESTMRSIILALPNA